MSELGGLPAKRIVAALDGAEGRIVPHPEGPAFELTPSPKDGAPIKRVAEFPRLGKP